MQGQTVFQVLLEPGGRKEPGIPAGQAAAVVLHLPSTSLMPKLRNMQEPGKCNKVLWYLRGLASSAGYLGTYPKLPGCFLVSANEV